MTQAVLGMDVGTTTVKALLMGLDGRVLRVASRTMTVLRPRPGWAEQDMDLVWSTAAEVIREVLAAEDVTVLAMGVTGQGDGAWLVDAAGVPIRPAILWLDGRSDGITQDWSADARGQAVWETTGSVVYPGSLPPLLEWLSTYEPDTVSRAAHHLNCKDWIRYRLTGVVATDPSEASRTYLDVETGSYSAALLERLGQASHAVLLPPVLGSLAVGGHVTAQSAELTGLPTGVPVIVGAVDTAATAAGLGLSEPGAGYAVLGTTAFYAVITAQVQRRSNRVGFTLPLGLTPGWIAAMAPMAAAPNLDWMADALAFLPGEWQQMEQSADSAGPGAGGVIYLPYLAESGERSPFVDSAASAAFLGITRSTTRGQLARAVYEGMALSLVDSLTELPPVSRLRLGGGASSSFACQVLADVAGIPVVRPRGREFSARGVAAAALITAGACADMKEALALTSTDGDEFVPREQYRPVHQAQARAFVSLRQALAPTWPALRALAREAHSASPSKT